MRRWGRAGRTIGTAALVLIGSSLWISAPSTAHAAIELDDPMPQEGAVVRIQVTDAAGIGAAGAEIIATYRPGSDVSRDEPVGRTGNDGSLTWTPSDAGLAALTATLADGTTQSANLSVRFRGLPIPGLVVMIVAGFILYGGVIRGFRSLGRPPPSLPPDT